LRPCDTQKKSSLPWLEILQTQLHVCRQMCGKDCRLRGAIKPRQGAGWHRSSRIIPGDGDAVRVIEQHSNLVNTLRRSHVSFVVFVSIMDVSDKSPFYLHALSSMALSISEGYYGALHDGVHRLLDRIRFQMEHHCDGSTAATKAVDDNRNTLRSLLFHDPLCRLNVFSKSIISSSSTASSHGHGGSAPVCSRLRYAGHDQSIWDDRRKLHDKLISVHLGHAPGIT
jgi:hypothetical protein